MKLVKLTHPVHGIVVWLYFDHILRAAADTYEFILRATQAGSPL